MNLHLTKLLERYVIYMKPFDRQEYSSRFVATLLFLTLIYSFFGYLLSDFFGYAILALVSLGILGYSALGNVAISRVQLLYIFLVLVFILINLLPAAYSISSETSIKTGINRSVIFMVGIALGLQGNWHRLAPRFVAGLALIHVFFTILSYFMPAFFSGWVLARLPVEVAMASQTFMNAGLYAGITNQIGVNAFYMSIGVFILYAHLVDRKQEKSISSKLVFLAFFLGLLLTGKRGDLLATVFSLWFVSAVNGKLRGKTILGKSVLAVILSIVLVISLVILFPEAANPFLRFSARVGGDITSGRLILYGYALDMFKQKPILGWGTGTFNSLYGTGTHNAYLQILCENGLVGLATFGLILLFNFLNSYKELRKDIKLGGDNAQFLLFAIAMQMFFITYAMTGNPVNDGFILIVYLVATSIPFSIIRANKTET